MPLISVVIPSYNCADFLPEALDSVLAQSLTDLEIIVVDDGSTDNTSSVMETYVKQRGVQYLVQKNAGPAAARNRGVTVSQGEFVAVLDADDALPPYALEEMLQALSTSGAGWCMIDVVKFWDSSIEIQKTELPKEELWLGILKQDFIRRAMFFRRATLERIGMWDESIWGREDWDINIRLLLNHEPFVYLEKALYKYRKRPGSITTSGQARFLKNTEKLLKKHHKQLADNGVPCISAIYAANMWALGRRYFYEQRNAISALGCIRESLAYERNLGRIFHPLVHQMSILFRS